MGALIPPCKGERESAFYNPLIETAPLFKPGCCSGDFCFFLAAAFSPPPSLPPPLSPSSFLSPFFWAPRSSHLFAHEKFHTSPGSVRRAWLCFQPSHSPKPIPGGKRSGRNFPKPTASTRENVTGILCMANPEPEPFCKWENIFLTESILSVPSHQGEERSQGSCAV